MCGGEGIGVGMDCVPSWVRHEGHWKIMINKKKCFFFIRGLGDGVGGGGDDDEVRGLLGVGPVSIP